jgi:beta-N-acetylhexosaminidase
VSDLDACLLARFPGTQPPDWLCRWLDHGLGGVVLFAPNITGPEQLRSLTAELRSHNPDALIAADEEGGIVTRVEARTGSSYPGNAALGAVGDTGLTRRVAACAKHFPGHGRTDADSHLALPVAGATLAELSDSDLVPFRAAIAAGVKAVMTAHVVYPAVDDVPATLSARFLTAVLRGDCAFAGVIITDALDMAAIGDDQAAGAPGAVRSLAAGADLLCLSRDPAAQFRAREALERAVRDGEIPAGRVEESAARVRELAAWARPPAHGPGHSPQDGAEPGTAEAAGPELGAEAARRGLLVATAKVPLAAPPFVIDAGGRMSSLLDDTAASLLGVLRDHLPHVSGIRLTQPPEAADSVDELIERAAGRPLVLAVADAHRRSWQAELIRRVLARRPDAVVVGTGTVHDAGLASGSYLGTRGAGRANLEAAADVLLGREQAR